MQQSIPLLILHSKHFLLVVGGEYLDIHYLPIRHYLNQLFLFLRQLLIYLCRTFPLQIIIIFKLIPLQFIILKRGKQELLPAKLFFEFVLIHLHSFLMKAWLDKKLS